MGMLKSSNCSGCYETLDGIAKMKVYQEGQPTAEAQKKWREGTAAEGFVMADTEITQGTP